MKAEARNKDIDFESKLQEDIKKYIDEYIEKYKKDEKLFERLKNDKLFARSYLDLENSSIDDVKEIIKNRINRNIRLYKWAVISIKMIIKKIKEYKNNIKIYHWRNDISPDLYIDDPDNEISAFFEITTALGSDSAKTKGEQIANYLLYSGSKNPRYVLFLAPTNFDFQKSFSDSIIEKINNKNPTRYLSAYSFNGDVENTDLENTPVSIVIKKEFIGKLINNIDVVYPPIGERISEEVDEKDLIVYEIDQSPPIDVMLYLIRSSIFKQASKFLKKENDFEEIIEEKELISINTFDIFMNIIKFSLIGIEEQDFSTDKLKSIIDSFSVAITLLYKTRFITDPSFSKKIAIKKREFYLYKNSEDFIVDVIIKYIKQYRENKTTRGRDADIRKFTNLK